MDHMDVNTNHILDNSFKTKQVHTPPPQINDDVVRDVCGKNQMVTVATVRDKFNELSLSPEGKEMNSSFGSGSKSRTYYNW